MQAWLFLASRRRRSELAEELLNMAIATQSDKKGIERHLKDLDT